MHTGESSPSSRGRIQRSLKTNVNTSTRIAAAVVSSLYCCTFPAHNHSSSNRLDSPKFRSMNRRTIRHEHVLRLRIFGDNVISRNSARLSSDRYVDGRCTGDGRIASTAASPHTTPSYGRCLVHGFKMCTW